MNNVFSAIRYDKEFSAALDVIGETLVAKTPLPILVNGLTGGMLDSFIHESVLTVSRRAHRISLILVSNESTGRRMADMLSASGLRVLYYPIRELVFHNISASHDTSRERLFVLHSIINGTCDAVVATPEAALSFTVPRDILTERAVTLHTGESIDTDSLADRLVAMGYSHAESVEGTGQFSHRGGIYDIFPSGSSEPVRIEFFGDEIDRMGFFDITTQRFTRTCEQTLILPAKETLIDKDAMARIKRAIDSALAKCKDEEAKLELTRERAMCDATYDIAFADKYLGCIYPEAQSLTDYFMGERHTIFICETANVNQSLKTHLKLSHEALTMMLERGTILAKYAEYEKEEVDYTHFLSHHVCVHLNSFSTGLGSMRCAGIFGFRGRKTVSYDGKYKILVEDLKNYIKTGYKTLLLTSSVNEAKSISSALYEDEVPTIPVYSGEGFDVTDMKAGGIYVICARLSSGYELIAPRVAVVCVSKGSEETSGRVIRQRKIKSKNAGERVMSFADLSEGDYVVHDTHGIGLFVGISTLRIDGATRDYITIKYAGTDQLFLPADRPETISKYIGTKSEDGTVKLSKMGGTEWGRAKSRAKAAAKDMAKDLIALYAERQQRQGYAFPEESEIEREFADAFEFEETEPQSVAIHEIVGDMEKSAPMERLLCGDVGFGKTEVALRAAFKAICAGKQVAILVPTTILALQHYQTAMSRMRGFPVNVEMLSRFRTAKETSAILRRLKRGDIDLIVGTHKLLGKDIEFRDLGLLIVDEEQRFGVAQKEKIKMRAKCVDVLTLTATPIPRTLNMAMSGIRDMSILDEAPEDRLPVQTYVLEYDGMIIEDAIAKELARKGQVLYLYNKVENIDLVCGRIAAKFPEHRVVFAHGQMEHDELESIWQALVAGEIDVLVCTTIIETGVDLPNANTLIIENADKMGLSQLHQIRGRIGRSGRQAYAYFTYRAGEALSEIATKRLEAIREFAQFGAGFKIALRDLEIRGAGNLLGTEQHGNIDAVGYDMYIRLLNEAVLEERGVVSETPFESIVDMRQDANIPDYYIKSSSARMQMYKKISLIQDDTDRMDVLDELCDRYGEPPMPTQRLLHVAMTRALASKHRIAKISQISAELRFIAQKFDLSAWSEVFASISGLRMMGSGAPYITYKLRRGEEPIIIASKIMAEYDKIKESE